MTENDQKCRTAGKEQADLIEAILDKGWDDNEVKEMYEAAVATKDIYPLLKRSDTRAKALFQMGVGLQTDIADDLMSIPDDLPPEAPE